MKVYQVKEITEYTKQVTEAVNKKFPGSNITEHMTREVLNIFQHNLRDQIIILNQHPATGKGIGYTDKKEIVNYHLAVRCITPHPGKNQRHSNLFFQMIRTNSKRQQSTLSPYLLPLHHLNNITPILTGSASLPAYHSR